MDNFKNLIYNNLNKPTPRVIHKKADIYTHFN